VRFPSYMSQSNLTLCICIYFSSSALISPFLKTLITTCGHHSIPLR